MKNILLLILAGSSLLSCATSPRSNIAAAEPVITRHPSQSTLAGEYIMTISPDWQAIGEFLTGFLSKKNKDQKMVVCLTSYKNFVDYAALVENSSLTETQLQDRRRDAREMELRADAVCIEAIGKKQFEQTKIRIANESLKEASK